MGNLVSKKKKSESKLFINLLDDYDDSISDLNVIQLNSSELNTFEDINKFQKQLLINLSTLQNKIAKLDVTVEQRIEEGKKSTNSKIYTINEQINLIHKDLKSLVNNDKILLDNVQKIISQNDDLVDNNSNNNNSIIESKNYNFENSIRNSIGYQNTQPDSQHMDPNQSTDF
mgnify:FL=1